MNEDSNETSNLINNENIPLSNDISEKKKTSNLNTFLKHLINYTPKIIGMFLTLMFLLTLTLIILLIYFI